jgi:hypothetical protein
LRGNRGFPGEVKQERRGNCGLQQGGTTPYQSGCRLFQHLRDHDNMAALKTVPACDKAIAADPKRADAYFIKGSALMGEGKPDKNNKIIVLPGTVEAIQQCLVLAPGGAHAKEVKDMLDFLK